MESADATSPHSSDGSTAALSEGDLAVKVAVHIRPLIGAEVFQGCKDCVSVAAGEPQVQIGSHSFTFDHVYGSTVSASSNIFRECIVPLVEGLFQGYNATVLAYGQTGSGKTYTMGTGYTVGGSTEGIIPKVMDLIFEKVASLKDRAELQIQVSFIEILKEEVHDLLDPNPPIPLKSEPSTAFGPKGGAPGKLIQIRENTNGEITLAGVTEIGVNSLEEMAACLERGSLCRATASTNMNSRSSRSHAIFTITIEQKQISDLSTKGTNCEEIDFLCAKLHLVDLAGSERAKRTGADGVRFKEGVHINKGLLALGNVISALGDEKKRKEGGHVPYRDSKLTRLLQDSLGGNSRTVMIACISPADSNAEETLNTLKYANRARNIQNKPVVNRDPMAAEMQRMRQQVELLQAELLCIREGGSYEELQILKQRISWLETSLLELQQELRIARDNLLEAEVERDKLQIKLDMIRNGKTLQEVDDGAKLQGTGLLEQYAHRIKLLEDEIQRLRNVATSSLSLGPHQHQNRVEFSLDIDRTVLEGPHSIEMEEETMAKEMEHVRLQDTLDKELEELNKRLEQKEAEMKTFVKSDGSIYKQHFEKKILELEEEKKSLQAERDALLAELNGLAHMSDEQGQKLQATYTQKVKALEAQILELKRKQENQAQLLKQKQRSDEAAKRLQEEIQRIKSQKVQLQNKIKQESEQFRMWKAMREKEVLQLKKEGRRNEYEMHKLQALHQRQKMVLQRKTEEAAAATRRLKELLEARKSTAKDSAAQGPPTSNGVNGLNEKSMQTWLDHELEVAVHIHEVRSSYEKQMEMRAALARELAELKEQDMHATNPHAICSMSPGARRAKIGLLESMLNASSTTLVAMASQLSEAEERERAFSGRARWQQLRSMGDAKNMLQSVFNSAVDARCKYWDKELEIKELKDKISEVSALLKQSEAHSQERDRHQLMKEQHISRLLTSALKDGTSSSVRNCLEEISKHILALGDVGPRQLEYPDDSADASPATNTGYELRQASHGSLSKQTSESEISEGEESDMDIDIDDDDDASDEDWSEIGERRPPRSRARKVKADKNLNGHTEQPLDTTQSDLDPKKQQPCCSCGRSSGCKTMKCACKAAGSWCSSNCGCSLRKCANRDGETPEVLEALETLTLEKEIKYLRRNPANECGQMVADTLLRKEDVQRAERVLVKHGAAVLENVWTDEQQETGSVARIGSSGHPSARKPLSDIGNQAQAEDIDGQQKLKPRKRWGKALVQLVPTTTAAQPVLETAIAAQWQPEVARLHDPPFAESLMEEGTKKGLEQMNRPSSTIDHVVSYVPSVGEVEGLQQLYGVTLPRDGPLPVKLHGNSRKKSLMSPPSSPLRARNNHAVVEEGGGALNKRLGVNTGTSASPRAPGKGVVHEKENA